MNGWVELILFFVAVAILGVLTDLLRDLSKPRKSTKRKSKSSHRTTGSTSSPKRRQTARKADTADQQAMRSSNTVRPDEEILRQPLNKLTWAEFERLLALYFRDHGYEVEETGVGGNDGGVDLVLTDKKTGERTAVQAKYYSDGSSVGPDVVREINDARRNVTPACHYAMLITSSDITQGARREADARHMKYWHGATLEHRLEQWNKWEGKTPKRRRPGPAVKSSGHAKRV